MVRLCEAYYKESPYVNTHEFDENVSLDYLRRAMIYPHAEVAVAEWNSEVVGFSVCYISEYAWTTGVKAHMEFLYVDPEHRDQNLAEDLIDHQLRWAKRMNAQELIGGDIGLRPKLMQRFLESQGFTDPGVMIRKILV